MQTIDHVEDMRKYGKIEINSEDESLPLGGG